MKTSRFIFTRITGDLAGNSGYIVRSRRTGLILGNVWRRYDPYMNLKRGWAVQYRPYTVFPTRLAAAKAL